MHFVLCNWVFAAGLVFFMALERIRPWRPRRAAFLPRCLTNFGLAGLNTFIDPGLSVFILLPLLRRLQEGGWGFLNLVCLGPWANIVLTLLFVDLSQYWVHRLSHETPLVWRIHKVHHSDLDLDATTGLRFHFLDRLLYILSDTGPRPV
ncbi:MAG: sterol desaturase family protein [Elusimicrobia bacterium]|nr:sterol desaturase family protein [Elusimicrobiota bacterium]